MITVTNLSKTYGNVQALKDVNIHFEEGGVYGIVGPNGAGKTTLFNCIAGIIDYDGQIDFKLHNAKNQMGFLATEPYFLSLITGREYLQFISNARKMPSPNFKEFNVFELPLDRFVSTYSSGMKKKLAITGILLQKNQIFVLDEPFNGVDIQSNILITEIILRLKALHKTIVISSHIFSTLTDVCDNFVVLKEGKIDKNVKLEAFLEIEKEMRQIEISTKLDKLKLL